MNEYNIVKLYGLPHSGSHYISWLIRTNIESPLVLHSHTGDNHMEIVDEINWDPVSWTPVREINRNKLGNKLWNEKLNTDQPVHFHRDEIHKKHESKELLVVCLMRDPYNWLYSAGCKHPQTRYSLEYLTRWWSDLNESYFESTWPNKLIVKYESLIDNSYGVMEQIRKKLSISEPIDVSTYQDTKFNAIDVIHNRPANNHDEVLHGELKCKDFFLESADITHEEFDEIFARNIKSSVLDQYNQL
jgi:hypothetical protein